MSSLLKYRFQKKESEKIASINSSQPTDDSVNGSQCSASPSTSQSSSIEKSVSSSSSRSLFETFATPEKKDNDNKSNVFLKRGAMVIGSDSESDSPIKKTSSPWLSKSTGVLNGSTALSSTITTNNTESKTEAKDKMRAPTAFKEEERELYSNLASLQEMYPGVQRAKLVEALASCGNDIDQAIDWIINLQNESNTRKRTYNRIRNFGSDSDDSSPTQPVNKKARPLEYTESQESTQKSAKEGMSNEEKVKFLAEAFPNFPEDILSLTLESKEFNLERASDALSSSGLFPMKNSRQRSTGLNTPVTPKDEPPKLSPMVSPTENVGSIKAYHYYQQQRMASIQNSADGRDTDSPPLIVTRPSQSPSHMNGQASKSKARRIADRGIGNDDNDGDYSGEEYQSNSDSDEEEAPSDPVINFFNAASLDELMTMDGCSKKKAEVILKVRPFENWDDLTIKIEQSKDLTWGMIPACKGVLRMRDTVKKLMQKCERIASNMEYIVTEVTGKTTIEEVDADRGYVTQQPKSLSKGLKLKPYQMVGLNWLNLMHTQDLNGILGDEMGLGKTIQTIAFIAKLVEDGDRGPHVVIVPSSTIDNWLRELHIWCPTLKVMLYYGSQEERRQVRFQLMDDKEECNVLVTTYNMASGTVEDRNLFKKTNFHYAVFDEGHMLKNMSSTRYQSLMKINASRRLLLTGTPLQNNLVELMSLLAFVMPDFFTGKTDQVKKIFTSISSRSNYETKGDYEKQTIGQAKGILKPFFLRRLKRDVLQQLPSKIDVIEKVSLAYEQADLYEELKNSFTKKLKDGNEEQKTAGSSMLMQLRKAANHHLLHRREYDATKLQQMAKLMVKEPTHVNSNVDYVYEDMEVMSDFELHKLCLQYKNIRKFQLDEELIVDSGKFRYLNDLLPQLKEKGSRVLLFSQFTMMMDIMEDFLHAKGHKFIRLDGQTPVAERQELIDKFNCETDIFVFLLSTKAGGLGINLTAADVVILHDIDFNPYNDKQAEDRCHRVGQTRDVTVYKLISKNTVEEAMLRCAQAKLQLEQDVTGTASGSKEEESPSDVASLLHEALAIDND